MTFMKTHELGVEKFRKVAQKKEEKLPFKLSLYSSQSNVRVDHRIFSNEKLSRNPQIGNAFDGWKFTILHANWQHLTQKLYKIVVFICNASHLY